PQPAVAYITDDVDFIPTDKAESAPINLKPVYPLWLDVRNGSSYPVFNAQRGFGANGVCTWPVEECAASDPWGKISAGQGAKPDRAGNDWAFPAKGGSIGRAKNFQGGTIIAIGGHLHPGGQYDAIDLVRGGKAARIFTSQAKYWSHTDHSQLGGPPTSWDFSMTVNGLPQWGVRVK